MYEHVWQRLWRGNRPLTGRVPILGILIGAALVVALVFVYIDRAEATAASAADLQIQAWVHELEADRLTTKRHVAQRQLEAAGEVAVPALLTAARSQDPVMRRNATEMLGYIISPRAAVTLVELLQSDPVPAVRRNAAWALGEYHDPAYRARLEQAAQSDKSAQVRQAARDSLERLTLGRTSSQPL